MTIDTRSCRSWRLLTFVVAALVVTSILSAGCSEQGSAEQLASNAPVAITNGANAISLQNRAGMALTDLKVTVVAYGSTEFSGSIPRLENTESREMMLNQLSDSYGASLNLRVSRPKLIRVRATDAVGRKYEVEMPWK